METESKLKAVQRLARLSKSGLEIARDFAQNAKAQNEKAIEVINSMLKTLEKPISIINSEGVIKMIDNQRIAKTFAKDNICDYAHSLLNRVRNGEILTEKAIKKTFKKALKAIDKEEINFDTKEDAYYKAAIFVGNENSAEDKFLAVIYTKDGEVLTFQDFDTKDDALKAVGLAANFKADIFLSTLQNNEDSKDFRDINNFKDLFSKYGVADVYQINQSL